MRLTRRDDSGVVSIFFVGCFVALLAAVAIAVDVSRAVAVHRSAQNSADAVALAMAQDCVRTGSLSATGYDRFIRTGPAIGNGQSQSLTDGSCSSGFVTATANETMDYTFAKVLGFTDTPIARSATATWGTLGTATTLPITLANCEFDPATPDAVMDVTVYIDDPKPQSGCSSLPGGFGLLDGDYDNCSISVTAGGMVPGQPGGPLQKVEACITNPTAPALPHDVLIPIYDAAACEAAGCKGQGPYQILGFAMFRVKGYSFNGNAYGGTLGNKCPTRPDESNPDTPKYCINGDFIRFVTSQGTPGPSTDFGTRQVYLSS